MISSSLIQKKITLRYSIAIVLVALLSSSAYFTFSHLLSQNEASASVINISGKQRMLSQRIALFSSQLVTSELSDKQALKESLLKTINTMASDHKSLTEGNTERNLPENHSDKINDMYFGSLNVDQKVKAYLQAARQLLTLQEALLTPSHPSYQYILANFSPLLIDLNDIVSQYQKEEETNVQTIKQLEQLIWLFTLLILVLEVLFIFKPMGKEVTRALRDRENYETDLEKRVNQQTEKLVKANKNLTKLSQTDPLTGLFNRRYLEKKIAGFHTLYTEQSVNYSVAIIDLDHFKVLNDTYGHNCGDMVLQQVGDSLNNTLEEKCFISRWGGEEFLIILPNCGLNGAFQTLEKLRKKIAELSMLCQKKPITVTCSIGIASTENYSGIESQFLIHQADVALYLAKEKGRNQVQTDLDIKL